MAVRQGVDPETFWNLTPYLTLLAMQGLQEHSVSLAWHIAAFSRQKKLKDVNTYFVKEKTLPPKDVAEKMKSMFKAHNKKVK